MAAIELDPTKTYYVNIRVLETTEPCSFITSIIDKSSEGGEKPPVTVPTCTESNWNPNRDSVYFLGTNARTPPSSPFGFSEADQVVAVKITPVLGTQKSVNMGILTDGEVDKVEAFVSECKGDFKNPPPFGKNKDGRCKFYLSPSGTGAVGGLYTTTSDSLDAEKPSDDKCVVDPNKDFYFNIRLKNRDTGSFACNQQTCSLSVSTGRGPGGGSGGVQPEVCTPGPVNQRYDFSLSNLFTNRATITKMPSDQVASVKFRAGLPRSDGGFADDIAINIAPVVGEYETTGMEVVISECPGNFENIPPGNQAKPQNCKISGTSSQISLRARSAPQFSPFDCRLERGKDYFLNIRYKDPITGQKCSRDSEGGCGSNVNLAYSSPAS